jgi:hypothetical protein
MKGFKMSECNDCKKEEKNEVSPNVVININIYDNRVDTDNSNYVDNVNMDSEE